MLGPARIGAPVSLTLRAPEVVEAARDAGIGGASHLVTFNLRVPVERSSKPMCSRSASILRHKRRARPIS